MQKGMFLLAAFAAGALLVSTEAGAGSGGVNDDGTIDITVNFRFPPSSANLTDLEQEITEASERLWDASEGQLRFGTVTFTAGPVDEDQADAWMFPQHGRATAWIGGIERRGSHTTLYFPSLSAGTFAHEFAHLALTLADEYSEQKRFGACWGYGECMALGDITAESQCMMQASGYTEFCTHANHDPVVGDGEPCPDADVDGDGTDDRCHQNCAYFNHTTRRYETTQQQAVHGHDCWAQLTSEFSFLTAPSNLPTAALPGGFTAPTFVNDVEATDTVLLVLDRSGSMGWNTANDDGEICLNGLDDDGDGNIDEQDDCTETRLEYLQAAARGFLELSRDRGVRVGIVSFNDTASLDAAFQDVNTSTYPALVSTVNGLTSGGNTAIGRALTSTTLLFGAETTALNKTAFLVSDGVNTEGEDPRTVVADLRKQGIRVFTISTGEASDDSTLTEIAGETGGSQLDTRDASGMVATITELWARHRNGNIIIPKMPYRVSTQIGWDKEPPNWEGDRSPADWANGTEGNLGPNMAYQKFTMQVAPDTERLIVVLGGNLAEMGGFGMEAILEGPITTLDSRTPSPQMRVVRDGYFVMVEVTNPDPGDWAMLVTGQAGSEKLQTGNLSVVAEGGAADLFTSLDRSIVWNPTDPVVLKTHSFYDAPLHGVDSMVALVKRPDGTMVPVSLVEDQASPGRYRADVSQLQFEGLYELRTYMSTGGSAYTDPGEELFDTEPVTQFKFTPFELTGTEMFYVKVGDDVSPPHRKE